MLKRIKKSGGFSLIELLAVLAIISILTVSYTHLQAEILKTACKTAANREMKALLGELEEKVHKGQTLFEAMESMHGCFPKLLVYMVQTGETSGTLDHILEKMSSYYEKEVEMAGKVRTAMIYPCILFFASIGASAFLLTRCV